MFVQLTTLLQCSHTGQPSRGPVTWHPNPSHYTYTHTRPTVCFPYMLNAKLYAIEKPVF